MNLTQQVATRQQAIRLREFGVDQNSLFVWTNTDNSANSIMYRPMTPFRLIEAAAFTTGELGVMLDINMSACVELFENKKEAQSRAYLLIKRLENKLISVEDVNKKLNQ